MMGEGMFDSLKNVTGGITLIAYLAALAAWVYVVPALAKLKTASKDIGKLPLKDRLGALRIIYGPIPDTITAEEWIKERRNKLYLIAFIAVLAAGVMTVIALLTFRHTAGA